MSYFEQQLHYCNLKKLSQCGVKRPSGTVSKAYSIISFFEISSSVTKSRSKLAVY